MANTNDYSNPPPYSPPAPFQGFSPDGGAAAPYPPAPGYPGYPPTGGMPKGGGYAPYPTTSTGYPPNTVIVQAPPQNPMPVQQVVVVRPGNCPRCGVSLKNHHP